MPTVHFSSDLLEYTGGLETVVVDAPRLQELKQSLIGRFPALTAQLDRLAVAIDGEIYSDADYHRLDANSEIYFVPRVAGGCQARSGISLPRRRGHSVPPPRRA